MATTKILDDFVTTLADAAAAGNQKGNRPANKAVVNALVQAEKAVKQQRLIYPLQALLGNWQLRFTAPQKAHLKGGIAVGRGFYVPTIVKAEISFRQVATSDNSLDQLEIGNSLQLSSLLLQLTGPARYLGKKNLLVFDFTYMQLSLFGRAVYSGEFRSGKTKNFSEQAIAKLPFFAFFLVTENLIAARGRGGGVALWVKN